MYTLREVTEKKVISNTNLGDSYKVFSHTHDLFKEWTNELISPENRDKVKYWVLHSGNKKECLFQENENYIVTESGKTFERL